MAIEQALKNEGITLPQAAKPAANYLSYVEHKGLVYISGQLPLEDGKLKYSGKISGDDRLEEAKAAARLCGVNLLAQIKDACGGDWTKFDRLIRLGIFVNSPAGFTNSHLVANGVSDFMAQILGEKGKHARSTVSVAELPLGALVEVECLFALKN